MNGSLTLLDDNLLYIAFSIIGISSKNDQKMKFRGRGGANGPIAPWTEKVGKKKPLAPENEILEPEKKKIAKKTAPIWRPWWFTDTCRGSPSCTIFRLPRNLGIPWDPWICSKFRSRDSQKSNPGIFRDFQKPLNVCIPRLSTTLIDHNRFFWDL